MASRILYEDNHVLVFNKRAGEITQGDRTGDEPPSLPETTSREEYSWEYPTVWTGP